MRRTIREILQHVADAFDGVALSRPKLFEQRPPDGFGRGGTLRLVSALAEGPDQWTADEALGLGYELQSPIPFSREEYERDFSDATALGDLKRLLEAATAVLELDGPAGGGAGRRDAAAYEAVGSAVLHQTDLLLAVWDGEKGGRGGTGWVVSEALRRGIPVVCVRWVSAPTGGPGASAPGRIGWFMRLPEWRLVGRAQDLEGDAERLKELVRELLVPPSAEGEIPTTTLDDYLGERRRDRSRFRQLKRLAFGLLGAERWRDAWKQLRGASPRIASWEASEGDWKAATSQERVILGHYCWANSLSAYYADRYRSAYLLTYLLAAIAVAFALLPMALGLQHESPRVALLEAPAPGASLAERASYLGIRHFEFASTACELVAIAAILALAYFGRRGRWHERWIDYRTLAERLRLARFLARLGGGGQQVATPAHVATYGDPTATWMHWYYLAVERSVGLCGARFSEAYLKAARQTWLDDLIVDQIDYHDDNRRRHIAIEDRLRAAAVALAVLTVGACIAHLALASGGGPLTFLTAGLPAFAASLLAIRTHSEAQRLARRSQAMVQGLERLRADFAQIPVRAGAGNSVELREYARRVSDLMIREMLDWRVVVLERPLELHI